MPEGQVTGAGIALVQGCASSQGHTHAAPQHRGSRLQDLQQPEPECIALSNPQRAKGASAFRLFSWVHDLLFCVLLMLLRTYFLER